jgi:hypothetical protein
MARRFRSPIAGHPRLCLKKEDADARDKRAHDGSACARALFSSYYIAIDVIR